MKLKNLISIVASALAFYYYKKSADVEQQYEYVKSENDDYINALLTEVEELEDKVNPNGNAHQAPLVMTCTVKMGGITLNQLEVWLNIRNTSDHNVEIGDIRSRLFVGGIRSERVIPSNLSHFTIPANKTIRVRLYARGDVAYPNNYNEVRRMLAPLCGSSGINIPNGTEILAAKDPVYLNLQYLWYWSGGEEECTAYNVVGDFIYRFASWTVGSYEGYNAGKEKQQEKNPSYWKKYDTQPMDEE